MWCATGGDHVQEPFSAPKLLRPLMPRPCFTRVHGPDLLPLNHHLARADNKAAQQVVVSSRWNPTAEQLQSLEELYRRGTRTPSAEQIQHITAELRRYGKIEGKNVFYWFQNHKARERQKRRRQQSVSDEKKAPNKTGGEHTKNWASPTNSTPLPEKSGEAEAGDGSVQWEEDAELQKRRNATWRMMNLSSSSSSPPPVTCPQVGTMQEFFNIFLEPYTPQTLQLFPLRGDENDDDDRQDQEPGVATAPHQFFEFLPLKN